MIFTTSFLKHCVAGLLLLGLQVPDKASGTPDLTTDQSTTNDLESAVVTQTVYACQDESLQISCHPQPDSVIKVVRANYGRFSIAICNEDGRADFSVNCHSANALKILQRR